MQDWRQQLGCTGELANLKPWTTLPGRQLLGISKTPRILAILDAAAIDVLGGASKAAEALRRE